MSNLRWDKISSRYLVREKWATLRVDTCKMPDGTLIDDYYVLEYPDWVNAVAFTEDDQVLLIRQYRHGAEDVFLEIPGGCIDEGETPEQAVVRELLEETGYAFNSIEKVGEVYANPSTAANVTHAYVLQGGRKVQEQHLDGREEIEVLSVSVTELKELLLKNEIKQALHVSSIFFALSKLGKL